MSNRMSEQYVRVGITRSKVIDSDKKTPMYVYQQLSLTQQNRHQHSPMGAHKVPPSSLIASVVPSKKRLQAQRSEKSQRSNHPETQADMADMPTAKFGWPENGMTKQTRCQKLMLHLWIENWVSLNKHMMFETPWFLVDDNSKFWSMIVSYRITIGFITSSNQTISLEGTAPVSPQYTLGWSVVFAHFFLQNSHQMVKIDTFWHAVTPQKLQWHVSKYP